MVENERILQNHKLIANTFNKYFCFIVKNISIPRSLSIEEQTPNSCVKTSINKYKDHQSTDFVNNKILNISNPKFSFNFVPPEQTLLEVRKLNSKKTSQATDIAVPIIKVDKDIRTLFTYHNFNSFLPSSSLSTGLKYIDVRPVFKMDKKTNQEKCRPARSLCMTSIIFT